MGGTHEEGLLGEPAGAVKPCHGVQPSDFHFIWVPSAQPRTWVSGEERMSAVFSDLNESLNHLCRHAGLSEIRRGEKPYAVSKLTPYQVFLGLMVERSPKQGRGRSRRRRARPLPRRWRSQRRSAHPDWTLAGLLRRTESAGRVRLLEVWRQAECICVRDGTRWGRRQCGAPGTAHAACSTGPCARATPVLPGAGEHPELSRIIHILQGWPPERLALLRKLLETADIHLSNES
jgi:hypothetical protein